MECMTDRIFVSLLLVLMILPARPADGSDLSDLFADLTEFDPASAVSPVAPNPPAPPENTRIPPSTVEHPEDSFPAPGLPVPSNSVPQIPAEESPAPFHAHADFGSLPEQPPPLFFPEETVPSERVYAPSEQRSFPDAKACLDRGKAAWTEGNQDLAQGFFEAALHEDPGNSEAVQWLRYIAEKKTARESRRYQTTRARMLETVQASWNTPLTESRNPEQVAAPRELTENEKRIEAMLEKLAEIRIPAIAFHDADVQQTVLELSALCRKLDPERKGINIIVFGTTGMDIPLITFSGTDLSMLETLHIIAQMSGMKVDAGPGLISLTPVHYEPPQQMVPAEFDINPTVGRKITAHLEQPGGGLLRNSGTVDVRGVFSSIPFPPGSGAQFNPEFNVLHVHHIPKYIEKISALLDRYNRKALEERSQQVEIETKFIEISQGALEELGFEWTLGTPGQTISSDTWTMPGGQKLFTDTLRSGQDAFGSSMSDPSGRAAAFNTYTPPIPDPTVSGLVDAAGEMLIRKVKGDLKADLLIRALERTAGSDLLSAPKIVARSGQKAAIHVGEVRWFPTAFNVKVERDTPPALVPEFYEEEKTGVLLEVTPELDRENGTIHLALSPEIRELAGFDEQHVGTIWPTFGKEDVTLYRDAPSAVGSYSDKVINFLTAREQNRTIYADRLIARRPVFKTRKVDTSVTIEDGGTIAMGGLIKEQLETFKDSVPFLGMIPLVGRFFRSEGERSVKRNLIIFVTAHRMDAGGERGSLR